MDFMYDNSVLSDASHVLLFDIVSYLISRFVSGTRVMDYSVPEVVKEKFISLMANIGSLLGRCGKVIISKKHVRDQDFWSDTDLKPTALVNTVNSFFRTLIWLSAFYICLQFGATCRSCL